MTNNRVKEIFNLRKELNIKSIKEIFKKYIDSDEETYRRSKFLKRIIILTLLLTLITFKATLYKVLYKTFYNTLITNIFRRTNIRTNNKYSDISNFYNKKNSKFYKS